MFPFLLQNKKVRFNLNQTHAFIMGRTMGIEPTNAGATIRSVNHFATFAKKMAGVEGFEPSSTVLETAALPLNYTPSSCFNIILKVIIFCKYFLNKLKALVVSSAFFIS